MHGANVTAAKNLNPARTKEVHSSNSATERPEPKVFLVGSADANRGNLTCCPTASTYECVEYDSGKRAIICLNCKRWGCDYCGRRRCIAAAFKCDLAKPTKFITLTVAPAFFESPRHAYDRTRRKISDLSKAIRARGDEFEYFRVLEVTKEGWPHYHLICRTPYIPQKVLSDLWAEKTGAPIVDVRSIKRQEGAYRYVLKYLAKQTYIPWTDRRVAWSKHFFPPTVKDEHRPNPYVCGTRYTDHPADFINRKFHGEIIVERQPGVYVIDSCTEKLPGSDMAISKESWKRCQKNSRPPNASTPPSAS